MAEWRKTILVAVAGLALSGLAYADMAPAVVRVADGPARATVHTSADLLGLDLSCPSLPDLGSMPLSWLPVAVVEEGESPVQAQPVVILTDRQDSLTLCLYALMGLGLCKSAPWVRRFSLVSIPEWYHDGGPSQIGHSLAVSPDCFCSAVVCFIQPEPPAEDLSPQYAGGRVLSLWRESQFIPTTLASRGPPICSC